MNSLLPGAKKRKNKKKTPCLIPSPHIHLTACRIYSVPYTLLFTIKSASEEQKAYLCYLQNINTKG